MKVVAKGIRVRFDLGMHLMSAILSVRGPSEAACRLTNQTMKPTQRFLIRLRSLRPRLFKVLYALPLSPAAAWSAFVSCGGRGE
jgi:hypothetical protein